MDLFWVQILLPKPRHMFAEAVDLEILAHSRLQHLLKGSFGMAAKLAAKRCIRSVTRRLRVASQSPVRMVGPDHAGTRRGS
jgi:hypothetical protein